MEIENTNDLKKFFSEENLEFLKNINTEQNKLDALIDQNRQKEEKYSLFLTALTTKDFSNTNREYFVDVKNTYSLLEQNSEKLKNSKNTLSKLSAKLLTLMLSEKETGKSKLINEINELLNNYIELLDEMKKNFVQNNISVNTFTQYHSTRLLLTTFDMDLGDNLSEELTLLSPNATSGKIETAYSDLLGMTENEVLIISEKENKVYLPYKKTELKSYMTQFPDSYYSYKNVIEKEFILPLNYFMKNQSMARFRETYALYRDREATNVVDAFKNAMKLAFKGNLNPAIIAACKTKKQLNNYLLCLNENKTDDFVDFKIVYDMGPDVKE